ncbi:tRNA (adenosine(37)-N6)-dimethylallyltransferase MiaA [Marinibaculum pumilum]|uniref:tRNA dimethylallyltransferase n=1 Tax=Marinibaculum pumilum TaxID=1766165 RepID=A0ABV7LA57_9PROT
MTASLAIYGPTGSGKSALALDLARRLDGEVVNADSMQVYRDLRLLSARPDEADCRAVPHHLYGHVDGGCRYSAAAWAEEAAATAREIAARDRLPILVGGTGLYLASLYDGLAVIPDVPPVALAAAEARHAALGGERFRALLARVDPELAARLPAGDRQRLVRGLAVAEATGRSLTAWQAEAPVPLLPPPALAVILLPPRAALYARCDARLVAMLAAGALEEVGALCARGLDPDLPVMKAVGVPHFAALLRGESDRATALALAQRDTRRYAKRQMTWARHRGVARSAPAPLFLPSAPWAADWPPQAARLQAALQAVLPDRA